MAKLRCGHAPGHVRDVACDAFEAWLEWDGGLPEPTVEHETNYVSRQIPISRACGLVWNCSDIMPGRLFDQVQDAAQTKLDIQEPAIKLRTYAACARYVLGDIKASLAVA